MTRAELATFLHDTDRAHREAIAQLTADIAAMADGDQKAKLSQFRLKLMERNIEFHAVLFETDDGKFVSLSQLILST